MTENNKRKVLAVGITVILSGVATYWGIQGIGVYGIAMFVITPLFIGMCPVILYGRKQTAVTTKQALKIAFLSLGLFTLLLIIFAIEGLICIAMAAPLAIPMVWAGALVGHSMITKTPGKGTMSVVVLMLSIPATAFMETKDQELPPLVEVKTSIEIAAGPEAVWQNVVAFPTLQAPTESLFKTGIAYPVNAEIQGQGVGAIRHCNFSTGSFVEPITVWDEPRLLKFDVLENPAPMRELSFYDIDAPHLHDYFISKQGQFKLTKLDNGNTLLEGNTWYYHNIRPRFYWKLWSDYIIHAIHLRVLNHIKETTEREVKSKPA